MSDGDKSVSDRSLIGRLARFCVTAALVCVVGTSPGLAQEKPLAKAPQKGAPTEKAKVAQKVAQKVTKSPAFVAPLAAPPLPIPNPKREAAAAPPTPPSAGPAVGAPEIPAAEPGAELSVPVVAKPEPPSPEAAYMAQLDELIAPVRDFSPSVEDAQRIKEAIRLASSDVTAARAMRAQIAEPAGRRLAEWLALKGGVGEPGEFMAFIDANPAWPERQLLNRRAEEQLFTSGGSAQRIKAFFKGADPKTGAGWAALASAYLAETDEAKAKDIAARTWRNLELASSLEQGFLDRFGPLLTAADHRRRLDRILVDEVRFSGRAQ